jgi:hypothetical protein
MDIIYSPLIVFPQKQNCIQEAYILKYVFFTSKPFSLNNDSYRLIKRKFVHGEIIL